MPRRHALLAPLMLALAACASPATSPSSSEAPSNTAQPTIAPTPTPSPTEKPTPSPTVAASASVEQLLGTWRTTLGGTTVTLRLTADTYRIHRGTNAADGEVTIDGDRIDFFNSSLCPGTGEYRWSITDGDLRFRSLTEPCPGRAEALLNVRYGDYSPP